MNLYDDTYKVKSINIPYNQGDRDIILKSKIYRYQAIKQKK